MTNEERTMGEDELDPERNEIDHELSVEFWDVNFTDNGDEP